MLLSAVNALTLSPALAALLLKPPTGKRTLLTPFYNGFNRIFGKSTNGYISFTTMLVRKFVIGLVLIGGLVVADDGIRPAHSRRVRPGGGSGLHPGQRAAARRGLARAHRRGDEEGGSGARGESRGRGLQHDHRVQPADRRVLVEHRLLLRGAEALARSAQRGGTGARRHCRAQSGVRQQIPEAAVVAFGPPAIPGLGTGAGFTMQLQDRVGRDPGFLAAADAALHAGGAVSGRRSGASRRSTAPRCRRFTPTSIASKVLKSGVPLQDVNTTLGALLGSTYVNDFNRFGRVYKVYVQAEPEYRTDPKQFGLFFVRGNKQMVPLDTLVRRGPDGRARVHQSIQPLSRRRSHRRARAGFSSAQALTRSRGRPRDAAS